LKPEIETLREAAESGKRNPRDIKAELAQRIIADFHSPSDARHALEEFNRIFQRKETPDEIEDHTLNAGEWSLPNLLTTLSLAASKGEARRLIEQGGVSVDGERYTAPNAVISYETGRRVVLKVGKRKFARVTFE
jgi:tyrosyl-tRNA synthetase